MPSISKIISSIELNSKILERNFTFEITRQLNSLTEIATIKIKKDYFDVNNISLSKRDKIKLYMQIDNEENKEIFSGIIFELYSTKAEYYILAESELSYSFAQEISAKSYVDTNVSTVLGELCEYEIDPELNISLKRFIIYPGQKRISIKSLLNTLESKKIYYFIDKKLHIKKDLNGKIYNIDKFLVRQEGEKLTIFPYPKLTLADRVLLKEKQYKINAIRLTNRRFILEVEDDN